MTTATPADAEADVLDALASCAAAVHPPATPAYDRHCRTRGVLRPLRPLRPVAVVEVHRTDELVAVLRAARAHGVHVATHGVGHGGAGDLAGAVLVVTGWFDGAYVDPGARTAHVGAGVPWGEVVTAAAAHRLVPACSGPPTVALAGYLTPGPGPSARALGVAPSAVRSVDLVTADGDVRRASRDEHPELFRTLHDGVGAVGVVTAVEVDLLHQPPTLGAGERVRALGI